jgi:hypothetical protein
MRTAPLLTRVSIAMLYTLVYLKLGNHARSNERCSCQALSDATSSQWW